MLSKVFLSIRWKLLIPFLLIVALMVGVLLPLSGGIIQRGVEVEADRRLAESADSVVVIMENSKQQALLSANFVANLDEVHANLDDLVELADVMSARRDELALEELSFYGGDFVAGERPLYYGGPVAGRRFLADSALIVVQDDLVEWAIFSKRPVAAIALGPQGSRIVGVAPVISREDRVTVEGVVLAGIFIDEGYVQDISRILGVDLAIIRDNAVVGSTIDRASGYEQLLQQGLLDAGSLNQGRTVDYVSSDDLPTQRRLYVTPLMLEDAEQGYLLVSQDTGQLTALQEDMQLAIAVTAAAITLTSVLFGVGVVIQMANPLARMSAVAQRVAEGDLSQRVQFPVFPRDEISLLGENFNEMVTQLEKLYTDLDGQVKERTAELAQAMFQLAKARDQALDASRTKSAFLATMSHELRTPLNAIIGYSQMMDAGIPGPLTDKQRDYVERVLRNGRHLLLLINDILDLAKIEAGRMELVDKPFDPQRWARDTVEQVRSLAETKHVELRLEYDEDMPAEVVGDQDRMKQVAINLLSNAIKFTKEGFVALRVRRLDSSRWEFSVQDTGIGIPSHMLEVIFDEFRQVDDSSRREFGGTGLGLAIVRNLCVMMGGNVRVTSKVGEGSTFIVTMPFSRAEAARVDGAALRGVNGA